MECGALGPPLGRQCYYASNCNGFNTTDSFVLSRRNNEHLALHGQVLQHCLTHRYITYFVHD